ncbi:hypothetical protein TEA_015962 [Camellia sinensis var. sinensis]|uniref:Uncharacterized protein n=1 Tax=Camellia sinensis var. sinensis TaxID=542762 RepID=A0A4S4F360_CAMSN|nr:hypothetical protein TEA_015962 [Camellia sinensis var. sinensis]
MGNKLGRRRQVVDEKFTRPQGLYQHKDVDHKKLKKLILDSKLAPCFPGDEDCAFDLEECPICFLTRCPFCKTLNYAVEYRGVKTKEEKGKEQIEEQRVIEAKIRMRRQELQDEEERMQRRQEISSSSRNMAPGEVEDTTVAEGDEIVSSQEPFPSRRQSVRLRQNRDDDFDLDLEDIMVMEAIWLSIQILVRVQYSSAGTANSKKSRVRIRLGHTLKRTHGVPTASVYEARVRILILKYHTRYYMPVSTRYGYDMFFEVLMLHNRVPNFTKPCVAYTLRVPAPVLIIALCATYVMNHDAFISAFESISTAKTLNPNNLACYMLLTVCIISKLISLLPIVQENGRQRNPTYGDSVPSEQYLTEDQHVSPAMPPVAESSSSPSGGLACAIAALAERQQTGGGSSSNHDGNTSTFNMIPGYSRFSNRGEQVTEMYHPSGNSAEDSPELGLAMNRDDGEWGVDHESEAAEVGTSRASSDAAEDAGRDSALPTQHEIEGGFQTVGGSIVPDSFEEQMMLAMAVSLADAQARTSMPGLTWQ